MAPAHKKPNVDSARIDEFLGPTAAERRRAFRSSLRAARARVQADAEGFMAVVHQLERLGRYLVPGGRGLGNYTDSLVEVVRRSSLEEVAVQFEVRLFLLKESRNDAAHQGAHARNASVEAVEAALALEAAMAVSWTELTAQDVMVRHPVVAEDWWSVGEVRREMLLHAYTCIPVRHEGSWYLLQDHRLARALVEEGSNTKRKEYERQLVKEVVREIGVQTAPVFTSQPLCELDLQQLQSGLLLVCDVSREHQPLVGVIAASDLL